MEMINVGFALVILIMFAWALATGTAPAATNMSQSGSNVLAPETASSSFTGNDTGVDVHASDGSLTGAEITEDVSTWPGASPAFPSDKIWNICTAVAKAEGFDQGQGPAPFDLNNPGDLSPGDESGQATNGPAQVHDGSAIIAFSTCEGGFIALYDKFANIVYGRSKVYPAALPWNLVAAKYAGDSQAWLNNVT